MSMEKKVVLVTGCSSGVGLYTAVLLAGQGDCVYASMRNLAKSDTLERLAKDRGVKLHIRRVDVSEQSSIDAVASEIMEREGRIDVLINNAGAGCLRALEEMTQQEVQEVFDTNFFGAVRCTSAVIPHMRKARSGHIIAVSSVGGLVGQPLNEVYCAAKFALEGMMESMATYMEPFFNIKFTLIEPAGIKSEFVTNATATPKEVTDSEVAKAYEPVYAAYLQTIKERGSFDKIAQTSEEVAAVIVAAVHQQTVDLRIQTSPVAKSFAAEKLSGDPSGVRLQKKIREGLLGIR